MGTFIHGIKLSRESMSKIEVTSPNPKALALNLLDALVSKNIQWQSNITGKNNKRKLDPNILDAIKSKLIMIDLMK